MRRDSHTTDSHTVTNERPAHATSRAPDIPYRTRATTIDCAHSTLCTHWGLAPGGKGLSSAVCEVVGAARWALGWRGVRSQTLVLQSPHDTETDLADTSDGEHVLPALAKAQGIDLVRREHSNCNRVSRRRVGLLS